MYVIIKPKDFRRLRALQDLQKAFNPGALTRGMPEGSGRPYCRGLSPYEGLRQYYWYEKCIFNMFDFYENLW